jgi:signal transduction histidine kinase
LYLINDILDMAKIEAGKMPVHVELVHLPDLIREVKEQIEPMINSRDLKFLATVAPDCPPIETDKTKVKQILLNLLSNALKFTNRGSVQLAARCEGEELVLLEVRDTGVGIKPEEMDAIWEDFRQLDQSTTRSYGGTGLGLSISRRLTHQLGGYVSVESEFGVGTAFSVRLPVAFQVPPS